MGRKGLQKAGDHQPSMKQKDKTSKEQSTHQIQSYLAMEGGSMPHHRAMGCMAMCLPLPSHSLHHNPNRQQGWKCNRQNIEIHFATRELLFNWSIMLVFSYSCSTAKTADLLWGCPDPRPGASTRSLAGSPRVLKHCGLAQWGGCRVRRVTRTQPDCWQLMLVSRAAYGEPPSTSLHHPRSNPLKDGPVIKDTCIGHEGLMFAGAAGQSSHAALGSPGPGIWLLRKCFCSACNFTHHCIGLVIPQLEPCSAIRETLVPQQKNSTGFSSWITNSKFQATYSKN